MAVLPDNHILKIRRSAVAADAGHTGGAQRIALALRAMALPAIQMRKFDMGGVREIDILGLARIDLPGNLAVGRHISVDEALLLRGCAHGLRVAADRKSV